MWREVAPIQVHSQILFDKSYIYTFVLNITSYLALYPPSTRLFYLKCRRSWIELTYDFGIHARIGNCTIANSYTMKGRCSTVYRTLTPGPRPEWARVRLRHWLVLRGNTVKTLYHTSSKLHVSTRPCVYMADLETSVHTHIVYSDIPNINIHRLWFSLKLFF